MNAARTMIERQPHPAEPEELRPPRWVLDLVGVEAGAWTAPSADVPVQTCRRDDWTLFSAAVFHADKLSGDAFRSATRSAYHALFAAARDCATPYFVRFWNFIPDIHRSDPHGVDRYMVFNAGRHGAFEAWYGSAESFDEAVPTATGIGGGGTDLVIHGLAHPLPGVQIHNPRQQPPHRYSNRFGPLPPCFARATLVGESQGHLLLIGGTASVCGEESLHDGQLEAQTEETFANLNSVVRAAVVQTGGATEARSVNDSARIVSLRDLRVYYRRAKDRETVDRLIAERVPSGIPVEFCQADICRRELLIEIEGTAWLPDA